MNFTSGKHFVAAGVILMLVGLLALSFAAPTTTVGQETDVPVDDDGGADVGSGAEGPDDGAADPPASFPNTGGGADYSSGIGGAKAGLITLLAVLGLGLAGVGALASRRSETTPN